MIELVEFNEPTLKREIKAMNSSIQDQIRLLKKERISLHAYDKKLQELERKKRIYMVSKTLPAKVDDLIINYKLFDQFLKRINTTPLEIKVEKHKVVLLYKTSPNTNGRLELYDMSKYFTGFNHIPQAVIT